MIYIEDYGHFDVASPDDDLDDGLDVLIHVRINEGKARDDDKTGVRCLSQSDYELFKEVLAKPWDKKYNELYLDDENYTDYAPMYYADLASLREGTGSIYGLLKWDERRRHIAARDAQRAAGPQETKG